MDKLKALESSLPPEQAPTPHTIDKLNQQVTQEFKIAANAVTSLYRLSSEKSSLNRHFGYTECVQDVLQLVEEGYTSDQIRQWCIAKQRELLGATTPVADAVGGYTSGRDATTSEHVANTKKTGLALTAVPEAPTFHLSRPPLSVEHSAQLGERRMLKPQATERYLQQRSKNAAGTGKRKTKKLKTR